MGKLYALGDRWPWFGTVLAVKDRYGELHGDYLASAVTLRAFISLFPLLVAGIAVVGFFSAGSGTDLASRVIGELGLTGEAADAVDNAIDAAERSRTAASIIGVVGLLWAGLGLVAAIQHALNQVWQVQERGLKDKVVALVWLAGAVVLFLAGAAATGIVQILPGFMAPAGILLGLTFGTGLWLWTSLALPNTDIGWRYMLPGAILGAIGLEVLKVVGTFYVPRLVESSSQLYGSLGVVFAVLAWLLLFGRLMVYSAVVNVVLYERKCGTAVVVTEVPDVPGREETATRAGRKEEPAGAGR
jgi:membrane protein